MEQLTAALRKLKLKEETVAVITNAFAEAMSAQAAKITPAQERAAANDLARTIATVFKPNKPKPYYGAIDTVACLNFIQDQKEYFEIVGLNKDMWVKYTVANLEDDAKNWWRSSGLTLNSSWNEFHNAFVTYHTLPNAVAAAHKRLDKLSKAV